VPQVKPLAPIPDANRAQVFFIPAGRQPIAETVIESCRAAAPEQIFGAAFLPVSNAY
jgi:hypothetical protein